LWLRVLEVPLEVGLGMQHAHDQYVVRGHRLEDHMRLVWEPVESGKKIVGRHAYARKLCEQLETTFQCQLIFQRLSKAESRDA
jgi:hypothetical protein